MDGPQHLIGDAGREGFAVHGPVELIKGPADEAVFQGDSPRVGFWGDGQEFIFAWFLAWRLVSEAAGFDFIAEEQRAFLWDEAGLDECFPCGVERLVVEGSAAVEEEVEDAALFGGEADLELADGDGGTEWNADT